MGDVSSSPILGYYTANGALHQVISDGILSYTISALRETYAVRRRHARRKPAPEVEAGIVAIEFVASTVMVDVDVNVHIERVLDGLVLMHAPQNASYKELSTHCIPPCVIDECKYDVSGVHGFNLHCICICIEYSGAVLSTAVL